MRRVLIVDDEFLVRLGLKTTIDWTKYGYSIVGEASNGKEALEMFDKVNPDVVITDIKMPIMDGLELIQEISKKKKVQVAILTNYDDFNYARKAIEVGSTQYILKSEINAETLIKLLKNFKQEEVPSAFIYEKSKLEQEEIYLEELIGNLNIGEPRGEIFNNGLYVALNGYCETSGLAGSTVDMMEKALRALVEANFLEVVMVTKHYEDKFYIYVLESVANMGSKKMQKVLEQCRLLIRNGEHYFNVNFRIGVSLEGERNELIRLIKEAEKARRNCFFAKDHIVFYSVSMDKNKVLAPQVSYLRTMSFIDCKKEKELKQYIGEIFNQLRLSKDYEAVKSTFIDFLAIAKSICEKNALSKVPGLNPSKFNYTTLEAMPFIENAEQYIEDIYETLCNVQNSTESTYSYTIKQCMKYIKEHYQNNITLEDVARAVEISGSYLSLLFKQETGINFSTYLSNYRIKEAQKLLATTQFKIYEIAEHVGFASPYYFSKIFKETTQMTCKEYKDSIGICDEFKK